MTDAKITPFLFEGEQMVRVIARESGPWFFAADACKAIGTGNPTMAVAPLDDDEKSTLSSTEGGPDRIIISEGGLYTLILRSRDATKPGTPAHRFRKWVTGEVLPAIRQTGAYVAPEPVQSGRPIPASYDEWTLEERRAAIAEVNTARHTLNQASAAWMWGRVGLPIPPRNLLPAWWQGDFDLVPQPVEPAARRMPTIGGGA